MQWKGQMSESPILIGILCVSGGFQDAYTFNCRDGVFANAQTGNMVLLGQNFAMGNWQMGLRFLIPVLAFAAGVYTAEKIRYRCKYDEKIHWRQIIILLEAVLLFGAGWLPQNWNLTANIVISFVCAMQVQSFKKMCGQTYATTMCIGNLRIGTEALCTYRETGDAGQRRTCLQYYGFIGIFIVGAAAGGLLTHVMAEKAIWVSSGLLAAAFFMMSGNRQTKKTAEQ